MVKESILLVASTSLLVYFVMPEEKPASPEAPAPETPLAVTEQPPAAHKPEAPEHAWGYEESSEEGQSFVFGEPVTAFGGDESSETNNARDQSDARTGKTSGTSDSGEPHSGSKTVKIYD